MTSFSAVPKGLAGVTVSPPISSTAAPGVASARLGVASVAPTIISARSRAVCSRGLQVATTLPRRRIVAASHKARISSSLCEMYRIAVPSAASLRSVSNRIATSCGVSTLVGSSMISSDGSCNRQRMISTLCRSPADRSPTSR